MADITLARPEAGNRQTITCEPNARFVFGFSTSDTTLARDGDNLSINFGDGSSLNLQGFYTQYNGENLPSFNIEGTEVAAADFFQAMNEPDLMPAAGPGTSATTAANARFHEYDSMDLAGGLEHLNGLDWGMSRGFEWYERPNSVGRNSDDQWGMRTPGYNPVTLTPDNPADLPDGTVDLPFNPVWPVPPMTGNTAPGVARDVLTVFEGDLANGKVVVHGGMSINAPDGVATITIGDRVIWKNGALVEGVEIRTDEGVLNNFSFEPSTGKLTYDFILERPTTEHSQPGNDNISHTIPVTVTDPDGDTDTKHITVVIRDDVPEANPDRDEVREGETVTGSVLVGPGADDYGQDGPGAFNERGEFDPNGNIAVKWEVPDGVPHQPGTNGNGYYEVIIPEGTVKLYDDGTYEFAADEDVPGAVGNHRPSIEFNYSIVDKDGDISESTLTIEIIPTNHVPDITPEPSWPDKPVLPGDPDDPTLPGDPNNPEGPFGLDPIMPDSNGAHVLVDEAAMGHGSGDTWHGASGRGSFIVDLHGESGQVTLSFATPAGQQTSVFNLINNDTGAVRFEPAVFSLENGVRISLADAVQHGTYGPWTVHFNYALIGNQQHGNPNAVGVADSLATIIGIEAVDETGDRATSQIIVEVHDDGPHASIPQQTLDTSAGVEKGSTISGFFELSFGYDGANSDAPFTSAGEILVKEGDDWILETSEGGKLILTNTGGNNWSYEYQLGPDEKGFDKTFDIVAKDGDGDTTNIKIDVKLNHKPTIGPNPDKPIDPVDPDDPKDKDPDPEPRPDPGEPDNPGVAIPVVNVDRITLDEGKQPQHGGAGHGQSGTDGSFVVNLHGGEWGVIAIGDSNGAHLAFDTRNGAGAIAGSITTANGVVLSGFKAIAQGNGQWLITYRYELDHSIEHNAETGHGSNVQATVDITVVDQSGDPAYGQIVVNVHDDVPTLSLNNTPSTVTVNMGADDDGTEAGAMDSIVVTIKGQSELLEWTAADGSSRGDNIDNLPEGTYASGNVIMVVKADGAYEFNLVPDAPENVELTVTATDSDKDTASQDVLLTVPTIDNPVPTPDKPEGGEPTEPSGTDGKIIVDEGAMEGGTGAHGAHGASGSATLTFNFNGEQNGTITIGDDVIGKYAIEIVDGTPRLSGGEIKINGVTLTIDADDIRFDKEAGMCAVKYTYSLTAAQTHDNPKASGDLDAITDGEIAIVVTDATGGNRAESGITVDVHDDAPALSLNNTPSTVTVSMGADDDGTEAGARDSVVVTIKGDSKPLEWTAADGSSRGDNIDNLPEGTYASGNVIMVVKADGAYEFNLVQDAPKNVELTVTATDSDKDIASQDVLLTVPTIDNPVPTPDKPEGGDPTKPSGVDGKIIVDEGAMEGGTGAHGGHGEHGASGSATLTFNFNGEQNGSITIGNDTIGKCTIEIDDGEPTLSGGKNGKIGEIEINGVTLRIAQGDISFDKETGTCTVKYTYKLEKAQKHGNPDASGDLDAITDGEIAIVVTDATGGNRAESSLTVEVHDDAPILSLNNTPSTVTVSMGADDDGTEAGARDSVVVTIKGDSKPLEWTAEDGSKATNIDNLAAGKYTSGQFIMQVSIKEDGDRSYEFNLVQDAPKNVELTVTAIDADEDTTSKDVLLTVPTIDNPVPTPDKPVGGDPTKPSGADGKIIVDEGAMEGGTGAHGGHGEHGASGSATLTFNFNGEQNGTITIGNDTIGKCTIEIKDGKAEMKDGTPTLPDGKISEIELNGVTLRIAQGDIRFDKETGTCTVKYTYKLEKAQKHDNPKESGVQDAITDGEIAIVVTDATGGNRAKSSITVEVHDDAPFLSLNNTPSTVTVSMGADDDGTEAGARDSVVVTIKGDNKPLEWTAEDGSKATNIDNLAAGKYTSGQFIMQVSIKEDGDSSYEFNLVPDAPENVELTVTATDSDKDTASKDVLLTVPTIDNPVPTPDKPEGGDPTEPSGADGKIIVDEGAMEGGTGAHGGHSEHGASGSATLTFNFNGEQNGTITIGNDTIGKCTIEIKDGNAEMKDGTPTLADGKISEIELNGVTLRIAQGDISFDKETGTCTVKYTYKLEKAQKHGNPDASGDLDAITDGEIAIVVTDATGGNRAESSITVEVHDDAPLVDKDISFTTIKDQQNKPTDLVSDLDHKISGQLTGLKFGADVDGATIKVSVQNGNNTEVFTAKVTHADGVITIGEFTRTGSALTGTSLSMKADGSFIYTRPEGDVEGIAQDTYTFTATVTDSDGDIATATGTVATNRTPDFTPPGKTDENYQPGLTLSSVEVKEENLPAGTSSDGYSLVKTGTLNVNTHGEGGTVTFAFGSQNPLIYGLTYGEKGDYAPLNPGTGNQINTGYGIFEITGIKDGVVSYKYILTNAVQNDANSNNLNQQIQVTITDNINNDVAKGNIGINIIDDAPKIFNVAVRQTDVAGAVSNTLTFYHDGQTSSATDFVGMGWDFDWTSNGSETIKKDENGGVKYLDGTHAYVGKINGMKFVPTFVDYKFVDGTLIVDSSLDVANKWDSKQDMGDLYNNPDKITGTQIMADKILAMGKDGLTVGTAGDRWASDEISVVDSTGRSEALAIDNLSGEVSYGLNIQFGLFGANDKAVICFYQTPEHSNDDRLVKMVEVTANMLIDTNGDGVKDSFSVYVPDGFTKMIIAAAPTQQGDEKTSSGFAVKGLQMTRNAAVYEGEISYNAGADGLHANGIAWDWSGSGIKTGDYVKVVDPAIGGVYQVKFTFDATTVKAEFTTGDGAVRTLFEGALASDGKWSINQLYKFNMSDASGNKIGDANFDVKYIVKDGDLDAADHVSAIDMSNPVAFERFDNIETGTWNKDWDTEASKDNAYDLLTGTQVNDLMYGKGGNDLLFGDGGKEVYAKMAQSLGVNGEYQTVQGDLLKAEETGPNKDIYDTIVEKIKALDQLGLDDLQAKIETGSQGHDALYGGIGNDILFGGGGDDYLSGDGNISKLHGTQNYTDEDILLGGSGRDIIVYDKDDAIIDGGEDIDVLLVGRDMADNIVTLQNGAADKPRVGNIEVMFKTNNATSPENAGITSLSTLAGYGIRVDQNAIYLAAAWGSGTHHGSDKAGYTEFKLADGSHTVQIRDEANGEYEIHANMPANPDGSPMLAATHADGIIAQNDGIAIQSDDMDAADNGISPQAGGIMLTMNASEPVAEAAANAGKARGGDLPETLANAKIIEGDGTDNVLTGTDADEILFGGAGNDFIDGMGGTDAIYAGAGDDLIVYDSSDYLIDGGDGIDVLLGNAGDPTLRQMLGNDDPANGPQVTGVEVLIKGADTLSLSSMNDLAREYGITINHETGSMVLGSQWTSTGSDTEGDTTFTTFENGDGITLETTLLQVESSSGDSDALNLAVNAVANSNG